MTFIDFFVLALLIFFFIAGWRKGFLRSILEPLCLAIGLFCSFLIYNSTHEFLKALLIAIVGPFFVKFVLTFILKCFKLDKDKDPEGFSLPNLAGGITHLLWSSSILMFTLLLILVIPLNLDWVETIQNEISASKSYDYAIKPFAQRLTLNEFNISNTLNVLQEPVTLRHIRETEEFQSLVAERKIRGMFLDRETARQIKDKDYLKLLVNPRMQDILNDPKLVKKILALNKVVIAQGNTVDGDST